MVTSIRSGQLVIHRFWGELVLRDLVAATVFVNEQLSNTTSSDNTLLGVLLDLRDCLATGSNKTYEVFSATLINASKNQVVKPIANEITVKRAYLVGSSEDAMRTNEIMNQVKPSWLWSVFDQEASAEAWLLDVSLK